MTEHFLIQVLQERGYRREDREPYIYVRQEDDECYVLMVTEAAVSEEKVMRKRQELTSRYQEQGMRYVYHLCILCRKDGMFSSELLRMVDTLPNLWIYTRDGRRFWQYEHQPGEFDGLNSALEAKQKSRYRDNFLYGMKKMPWVTILFILANVFCFLYPIFTWQYDAWIEKGMSSRRYVFEMGQYYRLFTSMFLHGGIDHLFNNMLVLLVLGMNLEPVLGKMRYILIYISSGILGGILSCLLSDGVTGSVGASGAIFGLSGAMLALVIFYRKQVPQLSVRRVVLMCISSLYGGFISIGVDNAAHIGGLLSGFVLVIITNKIHKKCT